eukprot:6570711-Prymnesium_polylepis.1
MRKECTLNFFDSSSAQPRAAPISAIQASKRLLALLRRSGSPADVANSGVFALAPLGGRRRIS